MASWYVYSGAVGTASGADWTNAKTTIAAAITAGAAGDTYYVAHDHAETAGAATTITFKGTDTSPDRCLCVNRAGSVPPVAADLMSGATVTTTGAFALVVAGTVYCYGISFNCGTGSSAANLTVGSSSSKHHSFDTCAFNLLTTSTNSRISLGTTSAALLWNNCTVSFGATGQGFNITGNLVWINKPGSVAVTGATIPTSLFASAQTQHLDVLLSGLDLSASGSGKTLVPNNIQSKIILRWCKLSASVTVASTPTEGHAGGTFLIGCDSTGVIARNEIYNYAGTLTTNTTVTRTAGASDGTTAYSWKIVTTANAKRDFPFETFDGVVWNDTTGSSKTLTVHTVTDNVTLKDDEIWVEVEYLGSSATPVATLITDAAATVLTAGANQDSDSGEAWTTTGLGTPVKQSLAVTFTPQMKGPIRWRVRVAKATTTVYVCPKADVA